MGATVPGLPTHWQAASQKAGLGVQAGGRAVSPRSCEFGEDEIPICSSLQISSTGRRAFHFTTRNKARGVPSSLDYPCGVFGEGVSAETGTRREGRWGCQLHPMQLRALGQCIHFLGGAVTKDHKRVA